MVIDLTFSNINDVVKELILLIGTHQAHVKVMAYQISQKK